MRLVLISDTHQRHKHLEVPSGDVLVHAGDFTNRGEEFEITNFNEWLMELPHPYKIVIPGNHDRMFQSAWHFAVNGLLTEATVLNESGITIDGLKFWGSPWTPYFRNWAFNYHAQDADKHWDLIPDDTDVLITHGPPLGIMDLTSTSQFVGCRTLKNKIDAVKPRLHVFGHIHECGGVLDTPTTKFVNASMVDASMKPTRAPIVVDL